MRKFNTRAELLEMVRRYAAGLANKEETEFLEAYYDHFENQEDFLSGVSDEERLKFDTELREVIINRSPDQRSSVKPMWLSFTRISAAAAIILILSFGLHFYISRPLTKEVKVAKKPSKPKNEIAPGGNIAVLTLADGTKINLDDAGTGIIAEQNGIKIDKQSDGRLIYTISKNNSRSENLQNLYNTIETPRGGEYQINLPDGTRVWLNAASSLRYPAVFAGKDRRVQLNGEAYFEVAANKTMPFLVESKHQVVEVFGTHFNINSYADESAVRTTLLEGSVKINIQNSPSSRMLSPGQQSVVEPSGTSIGVKNVNVEESIAWKNGYFTFSNENIQSIMREVSRWYNVDVDFKGNISTEKFGGTISKTKNISEVLRMLELTKTVHFKIEGRRVTVMH